MVYRVFVTPTQGPEYLSAAHDSAEMAEWHALRIREAAIAVGQTAVKVRVLAPAIVRECRDCGEPIRAGTYYCEMCGGTAESRN